MGQWEHLGYLTACDEALRACGIEPAAVDADARPVRSASVEVLVVGRLGYIEPLDLGWTEEHGWGLSRRSAPGSEQFEHAQFGGGVLPAPERFAELVLRLARGEELADHVPGERRAYRRAGDDDGFEAELALYGTG